MKLFRRRVAAYDRNIPTSGPPMTAPPAALKDYRIDGPPEAQQIARERRACETAPNGTGSRCLCDFDCANYWLRAKGYGA